jgi:two-component system cell cycle response regulator
VRGTILILDPVATNRILLKARLAPGCYDVVQAGTVEEAVRLCRTTRIDVLLTAVRLPDGDAASLCAAFGMSPELARTAVIVILPRNDPQQRLDALAAGAADVLAHPLQEVILLARLRSLVRASASAEELRLRETTSRALGLSEAPSQFAVRGRVALIAGSAETATRWQGRLRPLATHQIAAHGMGMALARMSDAPAPDVCVLGLDPARRDDGLSLLADLRARPDLRHAAVIAVLEAPDPGLAAGALDLGAGDVMPDGFDAPELALRLDAQLRAKRTQDALRANVRNGLQAALVDPLTGLYNRRYAMSHLARVAARAAETGRTFAVMMADLDHFKTINDRFGHLAGDLVLQEAARRLCTNLRAVDLVARVGGEELLIVLPDTDPAEAAVAGERLRRQIESRPFSLPGTAAMVPVTVSIGISVTPGLRDAAGLPEPAKTEALVALADRALYSAKGAGRNRTAISRPAA